MMLSEWVLKIKEAVIKTASFISCKDEIN